MDRQRVILRYGVGPPNRADHHRLVRRSSCSNHSVGERPCVDGHGLHSQCASLPANPLLVYRPILSGNGSPSASSRIGCVSGRILRVAPCWSQGHLVGERAKAGAIFMKRCSAAAAHLILRRQRVRLFEAAHQVVPNLLFDRYLEPLAATSEAAASKCKPAVVPLPF